MSDKKEKIQPFELSTGISSYEELGFILKSIITLTQNALATKIEHPELALHTPIGISKIPNINFNNNNRNSLYSSIQLILYVLEKVSENRKNDMQDDLSNLFNKYKDNDVIKHLFERSIGYNYI